MKLEKDKSPLETYSPDDVSLADSASRMVFNASLTEVISDFDKNRVPVPKDLIDSLIVLGRFIRKKSAK